MAPYKVVCNFLAQMSSLNSHRARVYNIYHISIQHRVVVQIVFIQDALHISPRPVLVRSRSAYHSHIQSNLSRVCLNQTDTQFDSSGLNTACVNGPLEAEPRTNLKWIQHLHSCSSVARSHSISSGPNKFGPAKENQVLKPNRTHIAI